MSTKKIMVIRHAEKPTGAPNSEPGVMPDGSQNKEALTETGWRRANALVELFNPANGHFKSPEIVKPQHLFASAPSAVDESLRPVQTITPLSQSLGVEIDESFSKEDEKALVKAAKAIGGFVLIAWQHERIPKISGHILGDDGRYPEKWDPSRFDLAWIFDRQGDDDSWSFVQTPQLLLPGDKPDPIPLNP
jgi:broad specificity phosphatase PhoE